MYNVTVGQLKKNLKDVPDDTPVVYQRIEDVYFDTHGWIPERLEFWDGDMSDYVPAFNAYYQPNEKRFKLEAHY